MFDQWWEHARRHYRSVPDQWPPEWVALYYDPIIDHLHRSKRGGHETALGLTLYLGPQRRQVAERLYDWAVSGLGWNDPAQPVRDIPGDPRLLSMGVALAREFGDLATYARLHRHAEERFEPTWDHARREFAYRFGLDDPHPRGQPNATIMMAEVGTEAAWWRLFNEPNLTKFVEPTVTGVDYPRLGISQAVYDLSRSLMVVSTYAADPGSTGTPTSFSVERLRHPERCRMTRDDRRFDDWKVSGDDRIDVATDVADHSFVVWEA